jgi:phytoene dehydrogenase-like protein
MQKDVIIIGAGVAGLTAAIYLEEAGLKPLIIEATGRVGGRVKTDQYQGFLLDRGFQVLLTTYPEAKNLLDYEALNLKNFASGAIILNEHGEKDVISDPLREPSTLLTSLFSSVGTIRDKFKILKLSNQLKAKKIQTIFEGNDYPTLQYLKDFGFSEQLITHFFQPFFSGIFLEKNLKTSRKMFEFVFKMFAEGHAALPALGIGQIPIQLRNKLNLTEIKFDERVTHLEGNKVFTNKNACYEGKKILIATEAIGLARQYDKALNVKYGGTSVLYFSADTAPLKGKYIALNIAKSKIINNLSVISNTLPSYAPKGKHLISLSTVGLATEAQEKLIELVKEEMSHWFGNQVNGWQFLKMYHVPYALPTQESVIYEPSRQDMQLNETTFICGDHLSNSSLNAAMKSGRLAAKMIIEQ